MQPVILRPHITINTLADLIEFWHKGVKAAKTNLTFAVHSTEIGRMNLADFAGVSAAQLPLLGHIAAEMKVLSSSREEFTREDRSSLAFTRHDSVITLQTYLQAWSELTALSPRYLEEWYENARARFGLDPTPMQYIQALAESYLPQRSKKGIHIFVMETDDAWTFRNEYINSRARVIFENLIQNSIKYGKTGGQLQIRKKKNDIIFEDDGIGMDPQFAAKLGRYEFIREKRAMGVNGTGTGWVSIGRELSKLCWNWDIETRKGCGTTVTIHVKEGDIIPYTPSLTLHAGHFFLTHPVTAQDIIQGAEIFTGIKPYAGYRFVKNGDSGFPGRIDVTRSPLYTAIVSSYILVPPLLITPLTTAAPPPLSLAI
jgi:hypothetical protein